MPEPSSKRDALVVIGNFDGVHRGHQSVLASVAEEAASRSLQPRLLTFDPHPAVTLGRTPPALLTRLLRKTELAQRACPGIEMAVYEFTEAFAAQSPEEFADQVLVEELGAKMVMVGQNFRFGKGRVGNVDTLVELGRERGFSAVAEPLVADDAGAWSSTRCRACIADGDLAGAREILGRPHALSGEVKHGDKRGRTIGFPTCNLPDVPEALPPFGVYAVAVDRVRSGRPHDAEALALGVANLGVRPTVDGEAPQLEVHLFDVEEDLYGAQLRVHLLSLLRPERRFDGLEALVEQIEKDADAARAAVATVEAHPERGTYF